MTIFMLFSPYLFLIIIVLCITSVSQGLIFFMLFIPQSQVIYILIDVFYQGCSSVSYG